MPDCYCYTSIESLNNNFNLNDNLIVDNYKEVIIIGNGPSGLSASYLLSGHWPYVSDNSKVSDEYLQIRLDNCDNSYSLVEHDLQYLSDGLEGRSKNPVALLYDYLNNPFSDFGLDLPSCLKWKYDPNKEIDHLIIGKGLPGGLWNNYDSNLLTISPRRWMELPGLGFNQFINENNYQLYNNNKDINERATVKEIQDYYQYYVKKNSLDKYMLNNATVTCVRKLNNSNTKYQYDNANTNTTDDLLWEVIGYYENQNNECCKKMKFHYVCKYLVLAVGFSEISNKLDVPGENQNYVLRSINDLEEKIKTDLMTLRRDPLLVVGCGLSAADCILLASAYRIKIIHVMRRLVNDSNIIFKKLSKNYYPEYERVYEKMISYKKPNKLHKKKMNNENDDEFILYDGCSVKTFTSKRTCVITTNRAINNFLDENNKIDLDKEHDKEIKISYACVLIGTSSNLDFLPLAIRNNMVVNKTKPLNTKDNPLNVNPFTLELIDFKNIFGMGPLIGDNFVRFGQAGALTITNFIWKNRKNCFECLD